MQIHVVFWQMRRMVALFVLHIVSAFENSAFFRTNHKLAQMIFIDSSTIPIISLFWQFDDAISTLHNHIPKIVQVFRRRTK